MQSPQRPDRGRLVVHHRRLLHLDLEAPGLESALPQRRLHRLDQGSPLAQLPVRHVDRDAQRRQARALPGATLEASGAQHPRADLDDETALLGERQEPAWTEQAPVRMLPAEEGLQADDLPAHRIDRRLVMQDELVTPQCLLERRVQALAFAQGCHAGGVELEVVPAVFLGPVHGGVRRLQESVRILAVVRVQAGADAGGHADLPSADQKRRSEAVQDLRGDDPQVLGALDLGEQDGELVAAHTSHRVTGAHAAAQPRPHGLQELVPGPVSQTVVDLLEMIEVDEQHGERQPVAARMLQRQAEPVVQQGAIRQIRQRVVVGQVLHIDPAARPLDGMLERARQGIAVELSLHHVILRSLTQRPGGQSLVLQAGQHDDRHPRHPAVQ